MSNNKRINNVQKANIHTKDIAENVLMITLTKDE